MAVTGLGKIGAGLDPLLRRRGQETYAESRAPLSPTQKLEQGYLDATRFAEEGLISPEQVGFTARDLSTGMKSPYEESLAKSVISQGQLRPSTQEAASLKSVGVNPYESMRLGEDLYASMAPEEPVIPEYGALATPSVGQETQMYDTSAQAARKRAAGRSPKTYNLERPLQAAVNLSTVKSVIEKKFVDQSKNKAGFYVDSPENRALMQEMYANTVESAKVPGTTLIRLASIDKQFDPYQMKY